MLLVRDYGLIKQGYCLTRCGSPLMAQSGASHGGEFTSAFGGVAEVHGPTASAAFDANDPSRKSSVHRSIRSNVDSCGGGHSFPPRPSGKPSKRTSMSSRSRQPWLSGSALQQDARRGVYAWNQCADLNQKIGSS